MSVASVGGTPPPGTWLGLWDASVASSLTFGTGSEVVKWADISGNGNDVDNSVFTTGVPSYSATGGASSKPTLVFGAGNRLHNTAFPMGTGDQLTLFFVGSMDAATDNFGMPIVYVGGGNHANTGAWYLSREGTNQQFRFNRNASSLSPAMVYNTTYRVICTIDSSGAMSFYLNGVATTGATQAGNWISGAELAFGELLTNPGLRRFVGTMSHVGISTAFTNSTDVATLDAFLQTKWGL